MDHRIFIGHFDRRLAALDRSTLHTPPGGWLRSLRMGLGMRLGQVAQRLGVTKQHIGQMERREVEGTISLNSLRVAAHAMDMELYYVLLPKDGSLQALVDRRAEQLAREVVMRTHQSMTLEDQAVSAERLKQAIEEQTADLRREVPKQLWD